ncbi:MAG TPA: poly-beta-1,6-N-acetyl-D-glucosamine N-deacetylase PgaB [Dyella sp.]|uniref:poly-beta-1,6-N-acetyl-D-glucosamine N-deacetylase PgaB n=1 Tax=Dyella sp. TaxID=1869338 RepID=UPI002F93C98F
MRRLLALLLLSMAATVQAAPKVPVRPALIVLAYHDVRDDVNPLGDRDPDAISTDHLISHFDWLKANGYRIVSLDDVLKAEQGVRPLPKDAVLLTFDDGLESFYTRVYPLLRAYDYPAVAALVGSWIDLPAGKTMPYNGGIACTRDCFLSWDQVREMQHSGLVEFASHTWAMHEGIQGNPQGNSMPAAVTLRNTSSGYESEADYTARIRADLRHSADEIAEHTGKHPRAIVWPYGAYTRVATKIAADEGMPVSMSLGDTLPTLQPGRTVPRLLVSGNITANRLGWLLRHQARIDPVRTVQVDLDYVYDPDPAQQERNLSALLDRIKRLQPSQVWLQAYADPNGTGVAEAVYFPNRHLPMRADLFSRVAWQLRTRAGVRVYAWLPVLAFRFPDAPGLPALGWGKGGAHGDVYRLAPWDARVQQKIGDVYEDLAQHADAAGLLFSDDAIVRDSDNLGPWADKSPAQRTAAMIDFTHVLTERVKRWRPQVLTARNIFAAPILDPKAEAWFAQSLPAFLAGYDMTAVMAMPQLDKQPDSEGWYRRLIAQVAATPGALEHTLFELATYDWQTRQPIPDELVIERTRQLQAAGVRHVGYYPDDFIKDHPKREAIRPSISISDYPYPAK